MLLIKIWNLLRSVPGLLPGILDLITGIKNSKDPEKALAEHIQMSKHRIELEARLRLRKPRK